MMRSVLLVVVLLVACKERESSPKPMPVEKPIAAPVVANGKPGAPVKRGTIRAKSVTSGYAVILGAGAKLATLEKRAR